MIYAITGPAYVGKTYLAETLRHHLGWPILSFSQGPRAIAEHITGMAFQKNWASLKNEPLPHVWLGGNARTGRELIMGIAENTKEVLGKYVWAKHVLLNNFYSDYIIDDLRFVSEWEVLKNFPHKIIRADCDDRWVNARRHGDPDQLLAAAAPSDAEVNLIVADITVNTTRLYPDVVKRLLDRLKY